MTKGLQDLVSVTQAYFQAEQAKLRDILQKEQALRAQLAALEAQHRRAQSQYHEEVTGPRVFGGDVLWQAWIERSRRQLQIELAQVLARKGQMISGLQLAHGRNLAAETLCNDHLRQRVQTREKRQNVQEQSLIIMASGKTQSGQ